jgi:hypothetical protein
MLLSLNTWSIRLETFDEEQAGTIRNCCPSHDKIEQLDDMLRIKSNDQNPSTLDRVSCYKGCAEVYGKWEKYRHRDGPNVGKHGRGNATKGVSEHDRDVANGSLDCKPEDDAGSSQSCQSVRRMMSLW